MVDEQETAGESKDGTGSGDHDTPYAWGNASSFLTLRTRAKLTIMRGYIKDHRAGTMGGAADGDIPPPSADSQPTVPISVS